MKAISLARITSSLAFLPLLGGVVTLSSACAASTEGGALADVGVEQVNEAISTDPGPKCAGQKRLPAKACNTVVCDGFEYMYQPTYNATACITSTGAHGTCATDAQAGQCLQTITGTITPKFYVVTVQYAPPGSASSVDYGTSSTSTTSTSTSDSFDNSETVSASGSVKGDELGGDISVSYSQSVGGTDKSSVEVKSTATTDVTINGFTDGVDHGLDRIYLLLKPTLNVTTFGKDVNWSFANPNAAPIYVTPDWLLNRSPMPAWILTELQGAGITPAEYADILSLDPYANANPKVDTSRYVFQKHINYEPLTVAGSKPTQTVYSTSDQTTITTSNEVKTSTKVAVSESVSLFKVLTFKNDNTMTWTYDNVSSASTASQLSVKATIVQPGVGYAGGEIVDVYLDTIFNTFLFVVEPPPLVYHGPIGGPISAFGF